jgi:hypothetical protein
MVLGIFIAHFWIISMDSEGGRGYLMGDSYYRFIFLFEEGMLNPLRVFEGNIIDILALKSLYYALNIKSFFQRWHIE